MFEQMNEQRSDLMLGVAVALIAFFAYSNSLANQFVWDDAVVIVSNSDTKGNPVALFFGIDRGRLTDVTPYYRPLTMFSFLVEDRLHGLTPHLVRLCNVLLHSACALLVYRFVRSFKISMTGALLAGLLFAVHPLHSEAVNFNAGGRNTMLATFFALASLLVQRWSVRRSSFGGACAGAMLFLAGLFSKETGLAILPFIAIGESANLRSAEPGASHRALVRLVPYAASLSLYLTMRTAAMSHAGVSVDVIPGLAARLLDNIYIIPRYLLNIAWPVHLSSKYFIPDDLHLYALHLVGAWLCIIAILWWLLVLDCNRNSLFGLAWIVACWLPVSGIAPIPSAPLADRYLYMPAVGVWLIVADQADRWLFTRGKVRRVGMAAAAVLLAALAVVTFRQTMIWRNDVTLFTRLVEQHPDKAYAHHNLGCAYLDKEKNLDLAQRSFEKALLLDPTFPRLRTQLGYICLLRGDLAGALQHYDYAVYLNPLDAEALLNRGEVLERLGRYADAMDSYRRFLALSINELPQARTGVTMRLKMLERRMQGNR